MATLQEQLAKAKKLTPNRLQNDLFKYIRSIEKEIVELNQNQIFEDSKDIHGNPIGFYSYATEVITKGRKKKGEPFDGFDTGDFLKGFYMQEYAGVLRFNSSDPKTSTILKSENWLSADLFGLSDDNLKKVVTEKLLPFFIQNIRNILEI